MYEKIKQNPDLMYNQLQYEAFFTDKQQSPIGTVSLVEENRKAALCPGSQHSQQLIALQQVLDTVYHQLLANDAAIDYTSTPQQLSLWLIAKDSLLLQLYSAQAQLNTLLQNITAAAVQPLAYTAAINAATPVQQAIETKYQLLNSIYLSTVAQGIDTFTPTQLQQLVQLAFECPLAGGNAVHRARALISLMIDTFYNDAQLCADQAPAYKKETSLWAAPLTQKFFYKLSPNPAGPYTVLQTSKALPGIYRYSITDNTGRTIIQNIATFEGQQCTIPTGSLPPGMYVFHLSHNGMPVFSTKLSIAP